jgi:O-antigen/teichoic acid export membrane protein
MLVGLYTVRVVLGKLGTEDYGIYNVVGGIVVLFSFLNGAMTSATQRFLNYTSGQNNIEEARDVYSISLILHLMLAVILIVPAETLGLWFLRTQLIIPIDRQEAALIVYQFSIVLMVINILRVPYNATVIAYEKMSFFAWISVIENILKLLMAFLLNIINYDSLILYAFLVCIVGIITYLISKIYCNKKFEIAHFRYCKDKSLFKKIVAFSGWSIFGGIANVSNSHGTNILLNLFTNVRINAAMGIATQVNTAVYSFVSNFQTAFNPQIIKSYAAKEYDYFMRLIFQTSKFSFYLLYFFVLPLFINADFVLQLWLKNVPEYCVTFTRLFLLFSLVDAICGPLWMSIQATGNIKRYQIIVSCFIFANLPLSFIFLYLGYSPIWVMIIKVVLNVVILIWRLFFLRNRIHLPVLAFFYEVILPIILISAISSSITFYLFSMFNGLLKFFVSCAVSVVIIFFLVYFIGFNKHEKEKLGKWTKIFLRTHGGNIKENEG